VWQCPDCGFGGNSPGATECAGCGFFSDDELREETGRRTTYRNEGNLVTVLKLAKHCLGSLLLLLPLAAMLLMVIYGIPELAPRSDRKNQVSTEVQPKPTYRNHGEMVGSRWPAKTISATTRRTVSSPALRVPRRAVPSQPGWRETIQRLQASGVVGYRIQPGTQLGDVHFSCTVTSAEQPRLVRRYETESKTPLAAARDVLQQIEKNRESTRQVVSLPRDSVSGK